LEPTFSGIDMVDGDAVFTLGFWTVKEGKQAEFVDAWKEFAQWTMEHRKGSMEVFLAKDHDSLVRFVTFGPWADLESIEGWRATDEFKEFFDKAKELCTEIRPMTAEIVAHIEKNRVISCVVERKE
jgi:quinol monooxygenase YgiN